MKYLRKKYYLCLAMVSETANSRFAEQELIGNAVRIGNSNRCCMSLPCAGRSVFCRVKKF